MDAFEGAVDGRIRIVSSRWIIIWLGLRATVFIFQEDAEEGEDILLGERF